MISVSSIIAGFLVAFIALIVVRYAWRSTHRTVQLGSVSEQWLMVHRTEER